MFPAWLILGALIIGAAIFACWPAVKPRVGSTRARLLLAAAVSTFVLGIGAGTYLVLGRPDLAARAFTPVEKRDYAGAVAALAHTMSKNTGAQQDPRGWILLARSYDQLGDQRDAAAAYRRAITLMVSRLETRLQASPGDPDGWQQLIRSEMMLGDEDRARAALAGARRIFAHNAAALASLEAQAKELKLQK